MLCDVCDSALKGGSQGKESCVLITWRLHSTFIKTVEFSKYILNITCLDRFEVREHMLCFVCASKLGGEPLDQ
jgi:hypothetical protein